MMLTAPDEVKEVERSKVDWDSSNSCTASSEIFATVVPTVSSVTSIPSIWTRVPVPLRPWICTVRYVALFVGSMLPPSAIWTPGSTMARSRKLRAFNGKSSICAAVMTPATVAVEVFTCTGEALTSTVWVAAPNSSWADASTTLPASTTTSGIMKVRNRRAAISTL